MSEKITYFGKTNFRNKQTKFGIKVDDRRRHVYVIGKTGMGKSQLLENMIVSDIQNGFGVSVVDPHGDLVESVLKFIPRNRIQDVIYFNPADTEYPVAFNVLENVKSSHRPLVADGVVGVFKKIWADSWGPRLEYILRNAILALLEDEDSTLLGVVRILTDRDYRESVVKQVTDPVIKYFWTKEFPSYPQREIAMIISPIQNKVGQYLANAMIRNIVGQPKSTINIREVMDNKKILLLNLSKGRIGEDTSNLLGALMITKLQLSAMSRVDIPEDDRQDFYLYVDELQNFATDSFAGILSEARKYHLNMTMAHQYVEQLPEALQAAIFGNVGTLISFRVGATDAEALAKEFTPIFTEEDFVNLPKFTIYLKLMIDGVASSPFSAKTLPPIAKREGYEDKIIKRSREKYSRPLSEVESAIQQWWNLEDNQKKSESKKDKKKKSKSETVTKQMKKVKDKQKSEKKNSDSKKDDNKEKSQKTKKQPVEKVKKEKTEQSKKEEQKKEKIDWHNLTLHNPELTFDDVYECDGCGERVHLEFEPRLDKPILCYKCIKKRDKAFKKERREKNEVKENKTSKPKSKNTKSDKGKENKDDKKPENKTKSKGSIKIVKDDNDKDLDLQELMSLGKKDKRKKSDQKKKENSQKDSKAKKKLNNDTVNKREHSENKEKLDNEEKLDHNDDNDSQSEEKHKEQNKNLNLLNNSVPNKVKKNKKDSKNISAQGKVEAGEKIVFD